MDREPMSLSTPFTVDVIICYFANIRSVRIERKLQVFSSLRTLSISDQLRDIESVRVGEKILVVSRESATL